MAKKRVEQPADDEQEPVEYELAAAEQDAVEDYVPDLWSDAEIKDGVIQTPVGAEPLTFKPGGATVSLDTPNDERAYRVSFALPYGVLVALLDPEHKDADVDRAIEYHLIYGSEGKLTQMGKLVLAGFDQTAVRHKMNAAWREQHNRDVGGVK